MVHDPDPGDTTEIEYPNVSDTHVPHEAEQAQTIDAQMRRTSDHDEINDVVDLPTHEVIATVNAPSSGYVEGEAGAAVTAINDLISAVTGLDGRVQDLIDAVNGILEVLRDAELLPASTAPPPPET